jgi:hypothetical protein
LCIPPGEDGQASRIVGDGIDWVAIIGQRAWRPRLVSVELLNALLLHLKTQVDATEELNCLLRARVNDDLFSKYAHYAMARSSVAHKAPQRYRCRVASRFWKATLKLFAGI